MAERARCMVPFCRRTIAAEKIAPHSDWICCKHWQTVPKVYRRVYSRLLRRWRRSGLDQTPYWKLPPGSPERISAVRMMRSSARLWRRMVRAAIERAAGL